MAGSWLRPPLGTSGVTDYLLKKITFSLGFMQTDNYTHLAGGSGL